MVSLNGSNGLTVSHVNYSGKRSLKGRTPFSFWPNRGNSWHYSFYQCLLAGFLVEVGSLENILHAALTGRFISGSQFVLKEESSGRDLCLTDWFKIINSLSPGKCGINYANAFFKLNLEVNIFSASCEIGLMRVRQNPIDDKSTLVRAMAWCHQATSQCLS